MKGAALHAAEKFGHRHLVEFLLEKGADPEVRNSEGLTPAEVGERAAKVSNSCLFFPSIGIAGSQHKRSRECREEDGPEGCVVRLRKAHPIFYNRLTFLRGRNKVLPKYIILIN